MGERISGGFQCGVEIAIGSLDDPLLAPPEVQVNAQMALGFTKTLCSLPAVEAAQSQADMAGANGVTSFQHPDHDTDHWPPETARVDT